MHIVYADIFLFDFTLSIIAKDILQPPLFLMRLTYNTINKPSFVTQNLEQKKASFISLLFPLRKIQHLLF